MTIITKVRIISKQNIASLITVKGFWKICTNISRDTSPEGTKKKKKERMADKQANNQNTGWQFPRRKKHARTYSVRDFLKIAEKDIKAERIELELELELKFIERSQGRHRRFHRCR